MARSFNGSTDNINAGGSFTLQPTPCTQSIWVNPGTLSNAYNGLIGWGSLGGVGSHILLKSTGALAIYFFANTNRNYDPGSHTLSSGTWYHVAATYDTTNGLIGYVGGSSDGTAAADGSLVQAGTFGIGYDPTSAGRNFPGRLSDAATWNVALTVAEIGALAKGANPSTIRRGALVGYWPLYGLASPEPDLSGNALNGTVTGTAFTDGPPITMFTPRWSRYEFMAGPPAAQIYSLDTVTAHRTRRITTVAY